MDTRAKINLGGLIVLGGLGGEDSAVVLGLVAKGKAALDGPDGEAVRAAYRREGDRAFKDAEVRRLAAREKAKIPND